ncbi:MAG: DNA mismatch repair endonuclease MutL [Deltaproteobacteria bacterium]|nr:DNA mismatch repair endonuclease MutL [Deltaproteobacteria bacterium]
MRDHPGPAVQSASQTRASIRILPDALVDQIAAGEVVERPASVAKELVENALDAGARRVRIEIRGGGCELVAVTDDGIGMTPDEARLALQRHATSKLASAEDLGRISSYGFRGEALPAIASVSRLRLLTRARGAAEGFEVRLEGGALIDARPAGGPEGTRVEVADLFARVPARRKFLKSPQTEWAHVADWAARMALARPGVHFELLRDDRPALVWPATSDVLARLAAVLSEADAAAMVASRRVEGGAEAHVLVSRPDRHRSTAEGLHLFVNGRPVRDRLLRHAVLEPYRDLLPRGRFPAAVVFVLVAPEAVDVNVHPAKWEVRFSDPRTVHHIVSSTVKQALGQRAWLGGEATRPAAGWRTIAASPHAAEGAPPDWVLAAPSPPARAAQSDPGAAFADAVLAAGQGAAATQPGLRFAELRLVGQLQCTYLLAESAQALLLVDQHAAHERVLYERLRAAWLRGGMPQQALLLPVTLDLSPAACAALLGAEEATRGLGFEIEPFGETTVLVRAVPALLGSADPAEAVAGLAEELLAVARDGVTAAPGLRSLPAADRLLATIACHAARRKGEALDPREQRALLAALDEIPFAPCCPHGRPVAVPISLAEIERRFGRR